MKKFAKTRWIVALGILVGVGIVTITKTIKNKPVDRPVVLNEYVDTDDEQNALGVG